MSDTLQASRFAHPARGLLVLAADPGSRSQGSHAPRRSRMAPSILLTLCLHAGVFTALIVVRQSNTVSMSGSETTLEMVSLPPAQSALAAPPQSEPNSQPDLVLPVMPDLAGALLSNAPAADASPPPTPTRPPPIGPTPTATPLQTAPPVPADLVPPSSDTAELESMLPEPAIAAPAPDLGPLLERPAPEPAAARPSPRPAPVRPRVRRPASDDVKLAPTKAAAATSPGPPGMIASASPPTTSSAPAHNASAGAAFEGRVRDAVQEALHYPAAARMLSVTGRARLELAYRAGSLTGVSLIQSAGARMLDDAAVAAAKSANYPMPPPEVGDHPLRFLIWVNFNSD